MFFSKKKRQEKDLASSEDQVGVKNKLVWHQKSVRTLPQVLMRMTGGQKPFGQQDLVIDKEAKTQCAGQRIIVIYYHLEC